MEQFNREKRTISFSYLDVFFLLLAFLIGSVVFYFATESAPANVVPVTYQIEAETPLEDWMIANTPEEGEPIFTEKGAACGAIRAVHTEANSQGRRLVFTVEAEVSAPPADDTFFLLQTKDFSRSVTVRSVRVLGEAK